jgi:hypothetical protein
MDSRRNGYLWTLGRTVAVTVAVVVMALALWSPVGAHDDGTTAHLWSHFHSLRDPGTINADTNPVHWTKLKGVPSSIADGVDNIGAAGYGLGLIFGQYYVDTAKIQRRVATACGTGQAIKQINRDGTIVCNTGPKGMSKRVADTGQICNIGCTEGTLTLTPGAWAITAKIVLRQTDGTVNGLIVGCELHAGGLVDRSEALVEMDNIVEEITLNMQLMATLTDNLNASINCSDGDHGSAYGSDLSIMAIRLGD